MCNNFHINTSIFYDRSSALFSKLIGSGKTMAASRCMMGLYFLLSHLEAMGFNIELQQPTSLCGVP